MGKPSTIITIKEVAISGVISLLVLVIGVIGLNIPGKISEQQDLRRTADLELVSSAIKQFQEQSEAQIPTYDQGKPLPTVTQDTAAIEGIDLGSLDGLVDEHISALPEDPTGSQYKVGVLSGGTVVLAATTSTGEPLIALVK